MTEFTVKNIKGTSKSRYNVPSEYNSWLDYYKSNAKNRTKKCHTIGCSNDIEVGAHVIIEGQREWYIVPLCKSCNKKKNSFTVKSPLVPVNLTEYKILK